MKKSIFTGAGVALVTPMNSDGSVNYNELERLIEFQIENKTDAIIVCATTGESACLSHSEHCEMIDFTVKKVNKRVPVIAGTGSNETPYAQELSIEAQNSGADAILSVTPYYNKTSQEGLYRHFTSIADKINIPMIVYNVPSRTGCCIKPTTYQRLANHENIVATKEANPDITALAHTMSLCEGKLDIYSGCDELIVPMLSLGGKGVISVLSNIAPYETHMMCESYLKGDTETAKNLQLKYFELISALFSDVNPIPVKAALNLMGFNVGKCRMPLVDLDSDNLDKLKNTLKKYNLI